MRFRSGLMHTQNRHRSQAEERPKTIHHSSATSLGRMWQNFAQLSELTSTSFDADVGMSAAQNFSIPAGAKEEGLVLIRSVKRGQVVPSREKSMVA